MLDCPKKQLLEFGIVSVLFASNPHYAYFYDETNRPTEPYRGYVGRVWCVFHHETLNEVTRYFAKKPVDAFPLRIIFYDREYRSVASGDMDFETIIRTATKLQPCVRPVPPRSARWWQRLLGSRACTRTA